MFPGLHSKSDHQESQELLGSCLVTATSHDAHAQPMFQQTMGPLSILQQPTQHVPTRFGEAWPMSNASH